MKGAFFMALPAQARKFDVVVVGGGLAGVCAALACARRGVSTARIHNRPVRDNARRLVVLDLGEEVACDAVCIVVRTTYGYPAARIFEVRVY